MKKIIVIVFILTILAAGYFCFQKAYKYAGGKMVEQIVKENSLPENATVPPVAPAENIPETENTSENENTNEKKEGTKTETKENQVTENALPKNIMDHPYVKSIYARFSAGEIAEVSGMMAGGVTSEEKSRIKQIVFSKVSRSEINKLQEIYSLYNK